MFLRLLKKFRGEPDKSVSIKDMVERAEEIYNSDKSQEEKAKLLAQIVAENDNTIKRLRGW